MIIQRANEVSAQAKSVAESVEASPTAVPNTLLLEALERKCKALEQACNESSI